MAQPNWITPAGNLGKYPSLMPLNPTINLEATSGIVNPALSYSLLSGVLPEGLSINSFGIITGTPILVPTDTTFEFVIRTTNTNNEIADRTFNILVSGYAGPKFNIFTGNLLSVNDSNYVEKLVTYDNPYSDNPVRISVVQGILPPGLELLENGLIRGYPEIPYILVTLPQAITLAVSTEAVTNRITCVTTIDFVQFRPIVFSGTTFGGIVANQTYYVSEIIDSETFTISKTQFGPEVLLTEGTGFMNITLPATVIGQPTIKTYSFDLQLESPLGRDLRNYSITVINQNLSLSKGGPGFPFLTRTPTILNTRPFIYKIPSNDLYFGYYVFPEQYGTTYSPNETAILGEFQSDNYFAFKIIGHSFDPYNIKYQFVGLPAGLTGNQDTGWIYGTPNLATDGVSLYNFTVRVYKEDNPNINSGLFNFTLNIYKNVDTSIVWVTPSNLGTIFNGTISTKRVLAEASVDLEYRLVSGTLPPNLQFLSTGEITGYTAFQPRENEILELNEETVFSFTIESYSPIYPVIKNQRVFNLTVKQQFDEPFDTIYFKAAPSFADRELVNSLLANQEIIPNNYLYRPDDVYFGKAKDIIYEHQYGVHASNIEQYLASINHSFYWRNITLGSLETAIARDENGNIIYEVVYSKIIDDLVNPKGKSISFEIAWPTPIRLNIGPWLTSVTSIETSYLNINGQNYFTSLTPGTAIVLWPNSLLNMNKKIVDSLGQETDSRILPLWMTSQQENGSTLGFTRAWVICYTKPGFAKIIKNNIETKWLNIYGEVNKLNLINFTLDRFSVSKLLTYNYDNYFTPPEWTGLPSADPVPDPLNSKDFNVLFPRQTILPDQSQI
jgi:hypothetical protein